MPDVVLKDDEVDKYLSDHLIKSLLQVLLDDYFAETHSEAAIALTTLYCALRSKNDYPARILIQNLQNINTRDISSFESQLVNSKSLRHQRGALLDLVRRSKNQEIDEMSKRKKELEAVSIANRKKRNGGVDVMNDPYTENGALGQLFGED